MTDIRIHLTDKDILRLPAAEKGWYLARDTELKGFFLVIGRQLSSKEHPRPGLTVVDLTGLPAQDIAVATQVYERITASSSRDPM
jgi:ornithine cyclodeaminase/alanine dehydrogenase-like protein (mu-crystallin family)